MKHPVIGLCLLGSLIVFSCNPKTQVSGSWTLSPEPRSVVENGESYVVKKALPAGVKTRLDPTLGQELKPFQQAECYRLDVTGKGITLTAATEVGILRGMQTLEKALPASLGADEVAVLPGATVFDYPEFPYRAFMLDCGRHFFPVETVRKVIDILALHQINEFHWHLSEDQGWSLLRSVWGIS